MPKTYFEVAVSRPRDKRVNGRKKDPLGYWWEWKIVRGEYGRSLGLDNDSGIVHNAVINEGERNILDVYFRNNNHPPTFYLGLHSGSISETATLADIIEPSGAGYARQQITRNSSGWPTLALDAGDFQAESIEVTFESEEVAPGWLPVNKVFLASTSSGSVGSVILEADLSVPRILVSQDTLRVTTKIKAQ